MDRMLLTVEQAKIQQGKSNKNSTGTISVDGKDWENTIQTLLNHISRHNNRINNNQANNKESLGWMNGNDGL